MIRRSLQLFTALVAFSFSAYSQITLLPNSAPAGSGPLTLQIFGQFDAAAAKITTVYWNSKNTEMNSTFTPMTVTGQEVTVTVPAILLTVPDSALVYVVQGSSVSEQATFTVTLSTTLANVTPNSAVAGSGPITITVNGTNFPAPGPASATSVTWNGQSLPTSYVSSQQLTATVQAALLTQPGTANISLSTQPPPSPLTFTIYAPVTLTSINPNAVPAGSPAFTMTVNGSGFLQTSTVTWNGSPLQSNYLNSSQLTASVPLNLVATTGTASVDVSTPNLNTPTPLTFTITQGLSLSSLSPPSAVAGSGSFVLTVNGTGFTPNTAIFWNNVQLTATLVNAGRMTASVPGNLIGQPGTASITAQNGTQISNALTFTITAPVLTLTSLSPSSAVSGGPAFTLTVNGSGFSAGMQVTWNGSQLATSFVNAGQLTASVPATLIAAAGTASVSVSSPSVTAPAPLIFTIVQTLSLTSLSPSSASAGGPSFTLAVNGAGFTSDTTVYWNGTALSRVSGGAGQITVNVPANLIAQPGSATITAQNGNQTSNGLTFTVTSAVTLTSLSPSSAIAGGPAFTLTVNGSGFVPGAFVSWNGSPLPTTFVNGNQMTASVPANLIATPSTDQVGVSVPGLVAPAPLAFTVTPNFILTSLSPSSVPPGLGGFVLTVTGTGFGVGTIIFWNSTALPTTVSNANSMTAAVPANLIAQAGLASITAHNGSQISNALPFSVTATQLTLTSLSPSSAAAGSPTLTLTVNGNGFLPPSTSNGVLTPGSTVTWNGSTLTTQFVSSNQITATVPAALLANPGTAAVSVTGQPQPLSLTFTITASLSLTSLNPPAAPSGGPAFTLTVNGSGFTSSTSVTWNGSLLTTTFVSSTQLNAAVPASFIASPGGASVSVSATGVQPPAPLLFSITQGIALTSLSPSSTTAGGPAFTLTVNGSGFAQGATIMWNSTALPTTFASPTQLNAPVTAALVAQPGTVSVTVTSAAISSNALPFTIQPPTPQILTLAPSTALAGSPAFTLNVVGTGFLPTSVVSWNTTNLTTTFLSATQLTAVVTANLVAALGTYSVVVNNGTIGSNAVAFSVTLPPPPIVVISSISPATASAGGPAFSLTVTGTGFAAGSAVIWNTTTLNTSFISPTQLVAAVTSDLITQPGTAQITVVSIGSLGSNAVTFTITVPTPTISSISPAMVSAGGGVITLTVNGTNFLSGATVSLNATALTTTFVSSTQLTATVPANLTSQPGTAQITAANTGGSVSNAVTLTIVAGPMITSISPSTVPTGGPAFTLTVNGSNFVPGSTVSLGTNSLVTTFVSSTQLTAVVPANLVQQAVTLPVTVTNPGGVMSNPFPFPVAPPVPTITSISPSTVTAGGLALTITVTGTGFLPGAGVLANNTLVSTTVVSPTQLTAQIPPNLIAQPGTLQITAVNTGGTPSIAVTLTVTPAPPTLTSISPVSARLGDPTFTLSLTGTGFVQASVAQWNGAPLSTTYISSTQLTATIDAGRLILPATASVTVVNPPGPDGNPQVSNTVTFTINPVVPTITSLSPTSVMMGSPAFSLTVNGTGFLTLTTIQWNTTALTTHFVSATQVTADVPATLLTQAGTVGVTAVNPGNNVSEVATFTVQAPTPAVLISLSKTTATAGDPSFTLTVSGTGFVSGAVVNFGTNALPTTFISATEITAAVNANLLLVPSTIRVTVTQANTTSNALNFTVNLPPPPDVRLNAPTGVGPAQQPTIDFGLNSGYPLPLTATLTLSFVPNATVPIIDPAIQFATGGQTMTIPIPANTTILPAVQISTGTVAGTITVALTLMAGNTDVTPPGASTAIVVPKSAPVMIAGKVKLVRATGYLEVDITGYSTTRDMMQAVFHLNAAPGGSFTSTDITVPLSTPFAAWYQSPASTTFGSQFSYAQPFSIVGDTNQIQSVTVTLTNSAGASVSMTTN